MELLTANIVAKKSTPDVVKGPRYISDIKWYPKNYSIVLNSKERHFVISQIFDP